MQWYLELFSAEEKKHLTSVQKESMKEMSTAIERMTALVEALLHAARLQGGSVIPKD